MKSIEWLVDSLEKNHVNIDLKNTVTFDIAKEMYKREIMSAFSEGINDECLGKNTTPEQYYNKTFVIKTQSIR